MDALTTDRVPDESGPCDGRCLAQGHHHRQSRPANRTDKRRQRHNYRRHGRIAWPQRLDAGWQCAARRPAHARRPADLPAEGWLAAQVPGTVASARRAAGLLDVANPPPLAFDDHWYRLTLTGSGKRRLRLHGLATLAEVWLDGIKRLESDSMFVAHDLDIELHGSATLALCFRSLTPALAEKRSRARWRPRLVSPPTLRNVRTTLLGHMPGWCPSIQAVGPWRPVELLGTAPHAFDTIDLTSRLEDDDGVVSLTLHFVHPHDVDRCAASLNCDGIVSSLQWRDAYTLSGSVRVPHAQRWWPHTHGAPTLYPLTLQIDDGRRDFVIHWDGSAFAASKSIAARTARASHCA